jgi:hypothetical protein
MEILNIDALAAPKRVLTFGGQQHEVLDLSVQDFIDNLAAANKLEAAKLGTAEEAIESMKLSITMIQRSVPTLTEEQAKRLNPAQVGALMQFIRGELDGGIKKPEGAAESDSEKKPS